MTRNLKARVWRTVTMAAAVGLVAALLITGAVSAVAESVGFQWPNGGTMGTQVVYQTPGGEWESMPTRCGAVFEDLSTYGCNAYGEPARTGPRGMDEAKLANAIKLMSAQLAQMQQQLSEVTQ